MFLGLKTEVSTIIKNSKLAIKFASLTLAYLVGSIFDIYIMAIKYAQCSNEVCNRILLLLTKIALFYFMLCLRY